MAFFLGHGSWPTDRLFGRGDPRPAAAADTPRRGGVLLAVIAAGAASLDPHQESTCLHPAGGALYSTLCRSHPYGTEDRGDVASDWKIAPDGLTYRQDPAGNPVHVARR